MGEPRNITSRVHGLYAFTAAAVSPALEEITVLENVMSGLHKDDLESGEKA